jgi:hypothetical protein
MTLTILALVAMLTWSSCGAVVAAAPEATNQAPPPDARFTSVGGATLAARFAEATARGRREATTSHFWVAYQFDVRPGIAVDTDRDGRRGRSMTLDGVSIELKPSGETRNVGVFMLYERKSERLDRVDIYNLDRQHAYDGHAVYWMGRAPADESFSLLGGLIAGDQPSWVAERAVVAISLHEDSRAAGLLERIVLDRSESQELRKHAATMLGTMPGDAIVGILRSLYSSVAEADVREQVITAAGIHGNEGEDAATVDFLIHVAETERSSELKRHAIFWLGQMAGKRSLGALEEAVNGPEDDVQTHAVFAISQRPRDEAVPILMNIARTHPRHEVRKKAIFWLGQIDDERVLAFLKEMLAK